MNDIEVLRYEDIEIKLVRTYRPPLDSPVNAVIVNTPSLLLLVDTGAFAEATEIVDVLRKLGPLDAILVTHYHWDHTLGLIGILNKYDNVEAYASKQTIEYLTDLAKPREWGLKVLQAMGISPSSQIVRLYEEEFMRLYKRLNNIATNLIALEDTMLENKYGVRYKYCPGHTTCHVCFSYQDIVFAGDVIVQHTSPVVLDIEAYIDTLSRLLADKSWRLLIPGHGSPLSRREAMQHIMSTGIRKLERIKSLIRILESKGEIDFNSLLKALYGYNSLSLAEVFPRSYNLLGYLEPLERKGSLTIDREASPWKISLIDSASALAFIEDLRRHLKENFAS